MKSLLEAELQLIASLEGNPVAALSTGADLLEDDGLSLSISDQQAIARSVAAVIGTNPEGLTRGIKENWGLYHQFNTLLNCTPPASSAQRQILRAGMNLMPILAYQHDNPEIISTLLDQFLSHAGVGREILAGMMGKSHDGKTAMTVSMPGGSENRVSLAYTASGGSPVFIAGCFEGPAKELLYQSRDLHGIETPWNKHYRDFAASAERLLRLGGELPLFGDAALARISAEQDRRRREGLRQTAGPS